MKKNFLPLIIALLALQACVKTKVENTIPLLSVLNNSPSSIRLFNFTVDSVDISVNNYPLTAYANSVTSGGTTLGLSLFPNGEWPTGADGSPFYIPTSLLDKNGQAHVHIVPRNTSDQTSYAIIDTVLQDDPLNARDYYVLDNRVSLLTLPRLNTPPAQAQNVKVRVINEGQLNDPINLNGAMTLTYADGTPVSSLTSNVAPGTTSPYVELPYGTYQFKLFISSGSTIDPTRQLTELPMYPNYDPCGTRPSQEGLFPTLKTYQPGGDYSFVVTPNYLRYFDCNTTFTASFVSVNAYRVVTELNAPTNTTYARMMSVNAWSSQPTTILVDGQALGSALSFGQPSDYGIFVQGTHSVAVQDASGNTLVRRSITLSPYDNYCLWAYPLPDGKADIDFAAVDVTGSIYASYYQGPNGSIVDDGTNGSARLIQIPYPWESRFLNLAPDLPYATFTNDTTLFTSDIYQSDSLAFSASTINLAPGFLPPNNPYVLYSLLKYPASADPTYLRNGSISPQLIRVYASSPGPEVQVPGTLLTDIAPVSRLSYIANTTLYPTALPYGEPGAYTTALIGKVDAASGDPEAARIIVIKHNK